MRDLDAIAVALDAWDEEASSALLRRVLRDDQTPAEALRAVHDALTEAAGWYGAGVLDVLAIEDEFSYADSRPVDERPSHLLETIERCRLQTAHLVFRIGNPEDPSPEGLQRALVDLVRWWLATFGHDDAWFNRMPRSVNWVFEAHGYTVNGDLSFEVENLLEASFESWVSPDDPTIQSFAEQLQWRAIEERLDAEAANAPLQAAIPSNTKT